MQVEQRSFKKLRISLTNQCNLACSYCVPEKYHQATSLPDLISLTDEPKNKQKLTTEELFSIVKVLHQQLNLSQIRLTGGEPLLHPKLPVLISSIKSLQIANIGLTTNGFLLPLKAKRLKDAGLNSVNISIDSINDTTFLKITKKNYLNRVLKGIDSAIQADLSVKLNAVVMRGINHHELIDLLNFAQSKGIVIRFIELMKMGHLYNSNTDSFYPANSMLKDISEYFNIEHIPREKSSTANYWRLENGSTFGIIANDAFPFCSDCDRIRLDEYGSIYGCISTNKSYDLNKYINAPQQINNQLSMALKTKQKLKFTGSNRSMINVGG